MANIVSQASLLFNYAVQGVSTVVTTMTTSGNELLMLPIALAVSCIAIGVAKRLINIFR